MKQLIAHYAAFVVAFLLWFSPADALQAQVPPPDFSFGATTGGIGRWTQQESITIDSLGHARYLLYDGAGAGLTLAESTFTVSSANLRTLWQSIQNNSFWTLSSTYADTTFMDGDFVLIRARGNGSTHQVLVTNAPQAQIQSILSVLNSIVAPSRQLHFTPPLKFNIVPQDPCGAQLGLSSNPPISSVPSSTKKKANGTSSMAAIPLGGVVDAPHPGTVVAYSASLGQAVKAGKAKLKSKGVFNGDAVSITVDNTNPQPESSIEIKLYIDFWGPQAVAGNLQYIVSDILSRWTGAKTSGGVPVDLTIVSRLSPDATSPPGTPGFHQIELLGTNAGRSSVRGAGKSFGVNYGTGTGQWAVDRGNGTYAHEAGHLMGLRDRYDDYFKQPDGSWSSSATGKSFANDVDFAQYVATKEPDLNLSDFTASLKQKTVRSVSRDGHDNDMMADHRRPLLQSDIDNITADPGLLVNIQAGDVLVSRDPKVQNLVVTHADDLYVPPGEKRTLNGMYGACIDGGKFAPDTTTVFDLVPPLSTWSGYSAAAQLASLVNFVDTTKLYCGIANEAQSAIWRFTDNEPLTSTGIAFLLGAGFNLGEQPVEFPHLTGRQRADTTAVILVPDELFAARISPRFASGTVNGRATFKGSVIQPAVQGFSNSFIWTVSGPGGALPALVTGGDSASFTAAGPGIYEAGLSISVNDPSSGLRKFPSPQKGYLLIPDSFTETFEHANLADRLPWKTFGAAPWKISPAQSVTGSYSAEGGGMVSNGITVLTSTLEIHLSLPKDSVITFFTRSSSSDLTDALKMYIDSVFVSYKFGYSDWAIERHNLKAGPHTLQWRVNQMSGTPGKFWIDNIFFPSNSIVSTVSESPDVPREFQVFQNFPNPFNPSTTIRYGLPARSQVTLVVFNTLGQQVAQLVNGDMEAGYHEVKFDGSGLSSGVYFYRIQAGNFVETRKLLLVR